MRRSAHSGLELLRGSGGGMIENAGGDLLVHRLKGKPLASCMRIAPSFGEIASNRLSTEESPSRNPVVSSTCCRLDLDCWMPL